MLIWNPYPSCAITSTLVPRYSLTLELPLGAVELATQTLYTIIINLVIIAFNL